MPNACTNTYHTASHLFHLITATSRWLSCIRFSFQERLPKYFEKQPAGALEIVAKDAAMAPAAYYMQGTADGKRPGRFYVNVSNLHQRPKVS